MLESLVHSLLLITALLGWGSLLSPYVGLSLKLASDRFLSGILAIVPLSFIALLLSYFLPLQFSVSVVVLACGLILFLWNLWNFREWKKPNWLFAGWMFFAFLLVGISVDNNLLGDSLLYHIQTLLWIKSEKLVLGLANLHDRFGLNSIWHLFLALVTPEVRDPHYVDVGTTSLMSLFAGFILFRIQESRLFKKEFSVFYITVLFVYFFIWGKGSQFDTLGSPGTDVASALLGLVTLILWIESLVTEKKNWGLLLSLVVFSIMMKLSQAHLGLLLILSAWSFQSIRSYYKEVRPFFWFSAIFGFLWILRTYLMSGCWIFPVPLTCIPQSDWMLPIPEVVDINNWIKSWARIPSKSHQEVLGNWNWMGPWIHQSLRIPNVQGTLVFLVFGLVISLKRWFKTEVWERWVLIYIAAAVTFWLLTAPDWRFIIPVAVFMCGFVVYKSALLFRGWYAKGFAGLIVLLGLIFIQDNLRITASAINHSPLRREQDLRELPEQQVQTSQFGVEYTFGAGENNFLCGFSELPCAPFARNNLQERQMGIYRVYLTGQ